MSSVSVLKFKQWHLKGFEMRDLEQRLGLGCPEFMEFLRTREFVQDPSFSLFYKGEPLAYIGVRPFWFSLRDCCEVWVMPSELVKKHFITYVRTVKKLLDELILVYNPNRIQAFAYDDDQHDKFFKLLKFEKESTMKKFAPDGNAFNAWVRFA